MSASPEAVLRYTRKYRNNAKTFGRCVAHPKSPVVPGRTQCRFCLDRMKASASAMKLRVMKHYGAQCACPGCRVIEICFLTIDHVNNDGAETRKTQGVGSRLYRWLVKNGFPDGFRVLCFNCNSGRSVNGGECPRAGGSHNGAVE